MLSSMKAVRLLLVILIAGALCVSAVPAHAAEIRSGQQIVIAEGEVIDDDLIISGDTVVIDGTITGDLLAGGTSITVNGVVEGSAVLLAQSVTVNGDIMGSMYSAAYVGSLGESAHIGRNMYYGGYALDTAAGSEVNRDAYVGGYQMVHNGRIAEDLAVGMSALDLNGAVGGDVLGDISVDPNAVAPSMFMPAGMVPPVEAVAAGLSVAEGAEIGGQVNVRETVVSPAVEAPPEPQGFLGLPEWFTNRLGEFIGLLLIGGLVIALLPRSLPTLGDELQQKPLPSFGWGLVIAFLLVPLAILVGIIFVVLLTLFFGWITFGEMVAGAMALTSSFLGFLFVAYLFTAYVLTKIIVGYWAGRFILSRTSLNPESKWTQLAYLALGLLIFEALRAIPVVGPVLAGVVMLFGLGAMLAYLLDLRRGEKVEMSKPMPALGV